jgi:hypothetical protein
MQKAPDTPGMRHNGVLRSFCSNKWGNCWRVNSDVWFCILGLQMLIQQPLESVLGHVQCVDTQRLYKGNFAKSPPRPLTDGPHVAW